MTSFDRIEQRLPELMADMASAGTPDYFEDMLRQAAAIRQRPAWASRERWLPMGVNARIDSFRSPSLRPILILALLGLLLVVALGAIAVASRPTEPVPLPAPFGPATNGQVLIGTTDGDIATLDLATGALTPLIGGATIDVGPWFSPDGQQFVFARRDGAAETLFVAEADGSNPRSLGPVGTGRAWWEWSPSSDTLVATQLDASRPNSLWIIDVRDGSRKELEFEMAPQTPFWRPGHDQIVFTNDEGSAPRFYLVNADGTGLREIPTAPGALADPALSPDGASMAYATWSTGDGTGERIYVVDIETGRDTLATPDAADGFLWQGPQFMPDGTSLLVNRYTPMGGPYSLAIVPADGVGPIRAIGPARTADGGSADAMVSPDGSKVLAHYQLDGLADDSTWLLDVAGGPDLELTYTADGQTWQRLAP
jgi:hypothetical protein